MQFEWEICRCFVVEETLFFVVNSLLLFDNDATKMGDFNYVNLFIMCTI